MRYIVALLIAVAGLFFYYLRVEENPITGAKQHVSLSPHQEISLGLRAAPQMAREMGGEVNASDPRRHVVEKLGAHLLHASAVNKGPWPFQFHLLEDSQTVNAFALPGGQIFITLGLLEKLSTEAELAGVLGHEIGHVIERHTAEQLAKNELGQSIAVAVGTATSDRVPSSYAIAALVNHMFQLRYSRKDELEADNWGLKLMEASNFHPAAMIRVMKVLKAESKQRGGLSIFQTHPNPDQRIKDIENYMRENKSPKELGNGALLQELYKNPSQIGEPK